MTESGILTWQQFVAPAKQTFHHFHCETVVAVAAPRHYGTQTTAEGRFQADIGDEGDRSSRGGEKRIAQREMIGRTNTAA